MMSIRKIFIKSISCLLLISSLGLPTFASTSQEKRVLPLKEAVKSAINTSTSLELLEKENQTNHYILDHSNTISYSDHDLAYTIKSNQKKTSYFKDKLEYLTENIYNQLIVSDLNLNLE